MARVTQCTLALLIGAGLSLVACGNKDNYTVDTSAVASVPATLAADIECPADTGDASAVSGEQAPREWRTFRRAHPYHVQGVSVGALHADGSRLLVISEPPPGVCADSIRLSDPALADFHTYRWRMGFDGWVRDAVVRLGPMSSDSLDALLVDLHHRLFRTNYGARVGSLTSENARDQRYQLDLTVTAAELRNWFVAGTEGFSKTGVGAGASVVSLLAQRAYGEHFSTTPGFVLWIVPLSGDVASYFNVARQWTIDSDLILGAIADGGSVAIIGREREVPEDVLPPLRIETIRTIAGAGTDHLAQSYERNFLFAGSFAARRDWAPIYLSPVLIDDEYGSLLNVTDQLLKSWTEHGTIQYANFRYPTPPRYPFDAPLHELLDASELTFNWNTKGAGYVTEQDGVRVYALNRTGALPVSYFVGADQGKSAQTAAAEERAYDYFASLNDPNLARVVQYAALYQLFREFGIQSSVQPVPAPDGAKALRDNTIAALHMLGDLSDQEIEYEPDSSLREEIMHGRKVVLALSELKDRDGLGALADRMLEVRDSASATANARRIHSLFDTSGIRRDLSLDEQVDAVVLLNASHLTRVVHEIVGRADREAARNAYLNGAARPASRWVRTASVVQSSNFSGGTGGHNLDAEVTHIRASADLSPGEVRVVEENGRKVVLANEADVGRLSGNVRSIVDAAESEDAAALSRLVGRLQERPIRPRLSAVPPPIRQVALLGGRAREPGLFGYRAVARELDAGEQSVAAVLQEQQRPYVAINRLDDGDFEIVTGDHRVVHAGNRASAVDFVASQSRLAAREGGTRQLQLKGFSGDDAASFTDNVEWRLRRNGVREPEDVVSVSRSSDVERVETVQFMTKEMDFSKARVTSVREANALTPEGERVFVAEVEMSSASGERLTFPKNVWFSVKEGFTVTIEAIQAVFDRVAARLGARATPEQIAVALKRELHGLGISHVRFEATDFDVAKAPLPRDAAPGD